MLKKGLIYAGIILTGLATWKFCTTQTDGFSLGKVRSNNFYHSQWDVPLPNSLETFTNQAYIYLGHGAQAYAFESNDGKYVIKFFRHHRHPLHFLKSFLPVCLKQKLSHTLEKRKNKLEKDFTSYVLASTYLPEETGIVYLHLNKTNHLHQKLTLYDKIGIKHCVDLDKMEFLIQKKAEPLYAKLEEWIAQGSFDQAKASLSALCHLLHSRCSKEIADKNPDLKTNFGIIENKPIQFDVGRFRYDPDQKSQDIYHPQLIRITDRLCTWLDEKAPELAAHLRKEVQET